MAQTLSLTVAPVSSIEIWLGLLCAMLLVMLLWLVVSRWKLARRCAQLEHRFAGNRVRAGHLGEAMAPLLDDFPVDVRSAETTTLFLGQPVDYVHFDPKEGITFVEVKSGRSELSTKQRRLRDHVEAGNVEWRTFRIS